MRKGFTLIELLAVIVILAIIALIATPIILGIINDAREESNERSVELYASAVRNGIAAYQLRTGNEVTPDTYTKDTLPFEVEYDGKVDCTSIIVSEEGKVLLDKCTVNGGTKEYSYGTKQGSNKSCTLDDKDGNGEASLSDVVTCGTESFYVIYNRSNEITMLSMYNLNVGDNKYPNEQTYGIQEQNAKCMQDGNDTEYGCVPFVTPQPNYGDLYTAYWFYPTCNGSTSSCTIRSEYVSKNNFVYDENSILYSYLSAYENYLKNTLNVNSAQSSLINKEQTEYLGCADWSCETAPRWFYSTEYWFGYLPGTFSFPYRIYSDSTLYADVDNFAFFGLRPVITISTSEIQ